MSPASGKWRAQVDIGGILTGPTHSIDPSCFQLKVVFQLKHKLIIVKALLDTGTAENFASQLDILLTLVYRMIPVTSVDISLSGQHLYQTGPVHRLQFGVHQRGGRV